MDNSQQNGAQAFIGCEMVMLEPEERVETIDDSSTILGRYGRLDSKQILDTFVETVKSQGLYVRDLPICLVRVTDEETDRALNRYFEGSPRLKVNENGTDLDVLPEIVQISGLDTSIKMSDIDPKMYLIIPFVHLYSGNVIDALLNTDTFVSWCKGIPCHN